MTDKEKTPREPLKVSLKTTWISALVQVIVAAALCGYLAFIVPGIERGFKESSTDLPLLTLYVLNLSAFVKWYWWAVIAAQVMVYAGFFLYLRRTSHRFLSWVWCAAIVLFLCGLIVLSHYAMSLPVTA